MKISLKGYFTLPIWINFILFLSYLLLIILDCFSHLIVVNESVYPLWFLSFVPFFLFILILPFRYFNRLETKRAIIIEAVLSFLIFLFIFAFLYLFIVIATPNVALLVGVVFTQITLFVLLSYVLSVTYNIFKQGGKLNE